MEQLQIVSITATQGIIQQGDSASLKTKDGNSVVVAAVKQPNGIYGILLAVVFTAPHPLKKLALDANIKTIDTFNGVNFGLFDTLRNAWDLSGQKNFSRVYSDYAKPYVNPAGYRAPDWTVQMRVSSISMVPFSLFFDLLSLSADFGVPVPQVGTIKFNVTLPDLTYTVDIVGLTPNEVTAVLTDYLMKG